MASTLFRPRFPTPSVLSSARNFSTTPSFSKQRLVVLGSGWAGYTFLTRLPKNKYDVTLISSNTYFAFTPLLASTAVGTLEFRCALEPVRRFSPEVRCYQAWSEKIDFVNKEIECTPSVRADVEGGPGKWARTKRRDRKEGEEEKGVVRHASEKALSEGFKIKYDKLVIAVGCYSQTFDVPGVKEYALFLKDVKDAREIRRRILECFEQASLPTLTDLERRNILHFVCVGGGPTGIEFAAELHDLLRSDLPRYYPSLVRHARISLYDVAPRVLGGFDESLSQYAETKFRREGINIHTGKHVKRVRDGVLEVGEDGEVPFGMLVWSTGLAPNPLIQTITELAKDKKKGILQTDSYCRVLAGPSSPLYSPDLPTPAFSSAPSSDPSSSDPDISSLRVVSDVWAIGDTGTDVLAPLPATAQVAAQQSAYLAKELGGPVAKGDAQRGPFQFRNRGSLAYVGDWNAIYDRTSAKDGPKAKGEGRLAWLLWRSAYFSQTLSWRNKISVAFYWFLNWIFRRDINRF